ncbi:MAG: toll/interleukin-1 receptor domain-containing protein [Lachnospiraceae bacterium]|nr:toll/interleukin-1 receptor domain-containing protein [Lachnospiraceae bacterium]
MAWIIGPAPSEREAGLSIVYKFVRKELPDYICAAFLQSIPVGTGIKRYEFDLLLFVPHMGVYVLDVRNTTGFEAQKGQGIYRYRNIDVSETADERQKRLMDQKHAVRHYMKKKFNITPLVYELECFPFLSLRDLDLNALPPDIDLKHVITGDYFTSVQEFLWKLMDCSLFMQPQQESRYYEDLRDKDAHDLYYFWDTGVFGAERPDRPPTVFLSYNRNNAQMSLDVQTAMEDRGVYVWRAPKDVQLGKDYFPEEMDAIEECDAFLILLSIPAQNSEEVKKEFDKALELGKAILPVWVENVPDSEINSYYAERLAKYQYRIMPKMDEAIIEEIVATVRRLKRENDKKAK